MPITNGPATSPMGGANPTGGVASNPFASMMGSLPQGGFQFNSPSADMSPAFSNIMKMLTTSPDSMTNSLMPGLSQILGLQTSSMMPYFQQQTGQAVAGAQSQAMQRGLTGSSIEAANMQAAQQGGNANMNQFIAQQLGQLGGAYQSSVGADVNAQNSMYQNIAQALGQQLQSQLQMQMFQDQMSQQRDLAASANKTALWGSLIGAGGSAAGGYFGRPPA